MMGLIVLALLTLGLSLRLQLIHAVQLYPDEFATLLAIQMIGESGLPILPSGLFYEHGLLFSYLGYLASLFGELRWAGRYASLLCGMITIGLTFYIGQRYSSPSTALIATTALTIAPTAIHWSGRARMYALLQLLVLLTLWLAYEGVVRHKPHLRWAALLSYFAATLTHFVAITLAPPLLLLAGLFKWHSNQSSKQIFKSPQLWLEGFVFALILLIAFLVKRIGQPKGISQLETSNAVGGVVDVLAIYGDFSLNLMGGWQAIAPFYTMLPAILFAPFGVYYIGWLGYTLVQRRWDQLGRFYPFVTFILLVTTVEMMLFVSSDRRDDKYLVMLLPILFLIGGHSLSKLGDKWFCIIKTIFNQYAVPQDDFSPWRAKNRSSINQSALRLAPFFSSLLISLLLIWFTWPTVAVLLNNPGDDYDNAFAYVQANWQAGDAILTGTPSAAYFYLQRNDFYSVQKRGGYDYRILTVDDQPVDRWLASPAIRTTETLHETLANQPVWLVLERWGLQREYYDLEFQQQIIAQTDLMAEAQGIFILRSQPNPRPIQPNPTYLVKANFANLIQLNGYTLEPEIVKSGTTLQLTLYWQALAKISHDYTVFVHLRPHNGQGNLAQADHRPLERIYPTHMWPIGETIRERSDLPLPAELSPGLYDLWVGLYQLETGERLPIINDMSGENAVKLKLEIAN